LINFRNGEQGGELVEITSGETVKNATPAKKKEINAILETIDLLEKTTRNRSTEAKIKKDKTMELPSLNQSGRNSLL
jgi:hypothetical protein